MNKSKKVLTITWQRLVSGGSTCPRCGSTESELDKAVFELSKKLTPMGIKVIFKKSELALEEFKKNPLESNRILFNNMSLESLISAETGQSKCCDVCGDSECRTLEINGESHEVITADVIIRAGLEVISK
jgi:hypothetical protein